MNTNNELYTVRLDTGMPHETVEEFTLPDYMPEVRRIVSCNASPVPENKYVEGSDVVLSGIVNYTVLYISEDGKLSAVHLSSEYSLSIKCGSSDMTGLTRDSIVSSTSVLSSSCRAIGPRKLSLGCRLYSKLFSALAYACGESASVSSDGKTRPAAPSDEVTVERKKTEVATSTVLCAKQTGDTSGEIKTRPGTKIIACNAGTGITDVRTGHRDVTVKGEACIDFLTEDTSGEISTVRIKSPIEEIITVGSTSPSDTEMKNASAVIRCAAITVSGGDEGVYTWNMEYDIDVIHASTRHVQVTDDIYSTKFETEALKESVAPLVCLKNGNSRLSVSSSKQVSSSSDRHVCHVAGKVSLDRAECSSDGKLSLSGSCIVYVVTVGGGEITMEEVNIPVKFDCPCEKNDGEKNVICEASVMYADARLEGDRLSVTAELCLSLFAYATDQAEYVSSFSIDRGREIGTRGSCVKIYFPEVGEEMWDIGKRYHCKVEKITRLSDGGMIIVS